MTKSVRMYDHFKVSLTYQSFLLSLTQIQYPLKVESPCSMVVWWIIITSSQPSKEDNLKLGDSALQSLLNSTKNNFLLFR